MESINDGRPARAKLRVSTLRECICIELLENLIMTGEIQGVRKIENLTNEQVENWYLIMAEAEPEDFSQQISEII